MEIFNIDYVGWLDEIVEEGKAIAWSVANKEDSEDEDIFNRNADINISCNMF